MVYATHFNLIENYLTHLDVAMGGIADPLVQNQQLGFVVLSAVTSYELAIKDIFFEFSDRKHNVLGNFARSHFDQINGRIKLQYLRDNHVASFGLKYVAKFNRHVDTAENKSLRAGTGSIKASYGNIITWRHTFVHQGVPPVNATYDEVKAAYHRGKEIIDCLAEAMKR